MAAFASFPVRAASDKAAALSANTGVPTMSKQHIVAKAVAMESSLKVVPQRIQLPKVGFRATLWCPLRRWRPPATIDCDLLLWVIATSLWTGVTGAVG